jgi:cyclopropane-fatty-acyl-phospholipid synthase
MTSAPHLAPPADRGVATAVALLARVFAAAAVPLAFRLWDGTAVQVGARGESRFAVVFRSRPAFRRILRRPTPLRFGEAFIAGDLDIEGDVFAAMEAATQIEGMPVPLGTKLAVLARSLAL